MSHPKEPLEEAVKQAEIGKYGLNQPTSVVELRNVSQKTQAEIDADVRQGEEEKKHKRKIELLKLIFSEFSVYAIGMTLVVALGIASLNMLFDTSASQESKAWARSTLTALSAAVAGYVFGKGSASKS